MKTLKQSIIFFIGLLLAVLFTACDSGKKETEEVEKIPSYSSVVLLELKDNSTDVFNLNGKEIEKVQEKENLMDILYESKENTSVYSFNTSTENLPNHNSLFVNKDTKKTELRDFYSAFDLKLNQDGSFLAFRSFKKASVDSAEGLKIYDINKNKYIDMKSKVLVSGNLYNWIDKDRILYYGSVEGEKKSNNIYVYDIKEKQEKVYADSIKGICTYFIPVKNNLVYVSMNNSKTSLNYYDVNTKSTKSVSGNVDKIINSVVDYKGENVFFIGREEGLEPAVYQFSLKTFEVTRITYDFPKRINLEAGICIDEKGYVYFCGTDSSEQVEKSDVYMYDITSKSVNLISNEPGRYILSSGKGRN